MAADKQLSVAVVCPGPSLLRCKLPLGEYGLIVGVNRAVEHVACNWWVFGDPFAFRSLKPRLKPGENDRTAYLPMVFTSRRTKESVGLVGLSDGFERALCYEDVEAACPAPPRWQQFSMTAALILAAHLGASTVGLFGVDLTGDRYCDGSQCINHSPQYRWANEEHVLGHVRDWLVTRSVYVTRYRGDPDGSVQDDAEKLEPA